MTKILAIDTTTTELVICLIYGDKLQGFDLSKCTSGHCGDLLIRIDNLLKANNIGITDIDIFACCIGVGSFTGIRIGVSTIRAFAQFGQKKVIPIDSLAYRAYDLECKIAKYSVLSAGNGSYYYSKFDRENRCLIPTSYDTELKFENFDVVASDNAIAYPTQKVDLPTSLYKYVLANLSLATNYENIIPFYLKKSQAEQDYDKKMENSRY